MIGIRNLSVQYESEEGTVYALSNVSLDIDKGDIFGLVGESGSGKSTLALSLMRLLPFNSKITSGSIRVDGEELTTLKESQMRKLRGKKISMVFQGAMNSLNPVLNIGKQVAEPLLLHKLYDQSDAMKIAEEKLKDVRLDASIMRKYPHQLSGGMKQRVVIASALVSDPDIIIADEPTTALDVVTQDKIMNLFMELHHKYDLTIIFITHDLPLISGISNRIGVLYGGKVVEVMDNDHIESTAQHPYTQALISSVPDPRSDKEVEGLIGEPINLEEPVVGCPFFSRCKYGISACRTYDFQKYEFSHRHSVYCALFRGGSK